jgi:hypothetical protein
MDMLTSPEYQRHQEIFYYRINPDTQTITEPTQRYNKGTIMDMLIEYLLMSLVFWTS